jgi:hypothetical protein
MFKKICRRLSTNRKLGSFGDLKFQVMAKGVVRSCQINNWTFEH